MALKSVMLVVISLSLVVLSSSATLGGWRKIEDPNAPQVIDIGKFAVEQHNTEAKTDLVFVRVVSGEQQVVSGTNYKLVISAKDGSGQSKNYQAVVWDKPWLKFRKLTSFTDLGVM